jgi:hypothetical protein
MHLSDDDRADIADWAKKTSQGLDLPFPDIDRKKAFLKRRQISNFVRGLKYYVTCGLNPLVSYTVNCLLQRGNPIGNVWGTAYVLDIGDYDVAYTHRAGYPVKNITIAFPFHERLYNLVMWGERRAIKMHIDNHQWLKLVNAKSFTWLAKILPNKEPEDFEDSMDWRGINFLKYTIADFKRILCSVVLDDFVISPQKMLYTFAVLSGKIKRVEADPRRSVYRVVLADATDTVEISIGFSGCKFSRELKEEDYVICLCSAFIFSTVPYAIEAYLIEESDSKANSAIGYVRFRRNVATSDFVEIWGTETLDKLSAVGVLGIDASIAYNPAAYDPSNGYKTYDPSVGKLRIKNVHRHGKELYDLKADAISLYVPLKDQLSPLPKYLTLAGDLFYHYGFPRSLWKEIYEFSAQSDLSDGKALPCVTCPVKLNGELISKSISKLNPPCIVWHISNRVRGTPTSNEFIFAEFEKVIRSRYKGVLISYDQGDMIVRHSIHVVRITPTREVIGYADSTFGEECEDLVEEFLSGPNCPYVGRNPDLRLH